MYVMEPREQMQLMDDIDASGDELLAIYHSHTRSAAYPSRTDVELAFFPDTLYLIVSIADRDAPVIRAVPPEPDGSRGRADRRGAGGDRMRTAPHRRIRRRHRPGARPPPAAADRRTPSHDDRDDRQPARDDDRARRHHGAGLHGTGSPRRPRRPPSPTTTCRRRTPWPGVKVGSLQQLADAQAFVDALYQTGDPSKPRAVSRLAVGRLRRRALRDQVGEDPAKGIALFRTYAVALRDQAAAQAEVDAAVAEVKAQTTAPTTDIDVSDMPGARGLHVEVDQGGVKGIGRVRDLRGRPLRLRASRASSTNDAALPQDEIIGAARDLYEKVTAAP